MCYWQAGQAPLTVEPFGVIVTFFLFKCTPGRRAKQESRDRANWSGSDV